MLVTEGVGIHQRQAAWCRQRLQNVLHARVIPCKSSAFLRLPFATNRRTRAEHELPLVPGPNSGIAKWPAIPSSRLLILSQCEGSKSEEAKRARSIYAVLQDRFDGVPPFSELTFVKKSLLSHADEAALRSLISLHSFSSPRASPSSSSPKSSPIATSSSSSGPSTDAIDFTVYYKEGSKNLACKRRTPLQTKNPELVAMTEEILDFIRADASKPQTATETPYMRSLSVLRCWPVKLQQCEGVCRHREDGGHAPECVQNLKGAHLLGPSTIRNVREALENMRQKGEATCKKLERFRADKRLCAVRELMRVPYVGIHTANRWVEMYRGTHTLDTIEDLKAIDAKYGVVGMNENIKVCLEHVDEILQKMPRETSEKVVSTYLEPVFDKLNLRYEIAGGYRRGKPSGHDIDILITSKEEADLGEGPFPKLVKLGTVQDHYDTHKVLEELIAAVRKEDKDKIELVHQLRSGAGQWRSGGEGLGVGLLLLRFPELENIVR